MWQCSPVEYGTVKSRRRSPGTPVATNWSTSSCAWPVSHSSSPGAFGLRAFITALRSPAPVMFPMLLTTSGGMVSAYWRGAPGADVSLRENRESSSTCLHRRYEDTSQASAPAMVRTFLTGSSVSRCAISSGSRVPLASNGNRVSSSAAAAGAGSMVVVMRSGPILRVLRRG